MSRKPKHLTRVKYQPKRLAQKPSLMDRLSAKKACLKANLKAKLPQKRAPRRLMKRPPRPQLTPELIRYKIECELAALNWRRVWRVSMAIWALTLLTAILIKVDMRGHAQTATDSPAQPLNALHLSYVASLPQLQSQFDLTGPQRLTDPVPVATIGQTAIYSANPADVTEADLEELRTIYAEDAEPETVTDAEATADTVTEDAETLEWTTRVTQDEPPAKVNPETDMTYNDYYALFTPRVRATFCQAGWGEADVIKSDCEVAMCYCVIFNRYDVGVFGDTFEEIITRPNQFTGYRASNPITERHEQLLEIIIDQWIRMQLGESPDEVGWPIPRDILYWHANANYTHNLFYKYENFNSGRKIYFDYSQPLHNPYGS